MRENALPTKSPVNIYDFTDRPTRVLGLELYSTRGTVCWCRRPDADLSFHTGRILLKDIEGYVGRVGPAHFPVQGSLRPMIARSTTIQNIMSPPNPDQKK